MSKVVLIDTVSGRLVTFVVANGDSFTAHVREAVSRASPISTNRGGAVGAFFAEFN